MVAHDQHQLTPEAGRQRLDVVDLVQQDLGFNSYRAPLTERGRLDVFLATATLAGGGAGGSRGPGDEGWAAVAGGGPRRLGHHQATSTTTAAGTTQVTPTSTPAAARHRAKLTGLCTRRDGIGYRALANGFATCEDPDALQAICDRFGPTDIQEFFDRWIATIPTPRSAADRAAGYWWELWVRQVEVSKTLTFDDPRRARGFFEALVADNIGIGRPHEVAMVFARPLRRPTQHPYRSRIFTPGTEVKLDFRYKHSRVKQYLKEGRALRIETVINRPSDLDCRARLEHLPELVAKGRGVNSRLLMIERAGQGCAIGSGLFERIHQPYIREGQRTGALRFGDPRAMALTGALCVFVHAVAGFTNKSLRGLVAGLLGRDHTRSQMTYHLRRLRLHGLIERIPKTNTYVLTDPGVRVAVFYNKIHDRLLRPLIAAGHQPPAPIELRRALTTINRVIADYVDHARLTPAA